MPINLEDHKIFIKDLNMEVVPYSVAMQAMQELAQSFAQYSEGMVDFQSELKKVNEAFKEFGSELKHAFDEMDDLIDFDKANKQDQ